MSLTTLIPKDYHRVALREDRVGLWLVEIFYNVDEQKFMVKHIEINQVLGPLTLSQLSDIAVAVKDVEWAHGNYTTIPDQEPDDEAG